MELFLSPVYSFFYAISYNRVPVPLPRPLSVDPRSLTVILDSDP